MSIQTTASERDESRRKRRSNDTATRTSDADTSEAAQETDAPRDTAPTHRNASDRPIDGGSSTADRQPTSRAARLQQGQGNRAVARAAAAARDRRDGTESPEDTVGAGDMRGTARRGNENATDATASTAPEGSGGVESSSSRRQSGSSVRAGTQATPGTSAADVESAAPREQRDTGSQASETGATGEGNRNTTKRAQQEGREPSDHAETNQAAPLANRQGSHATPTGPQLDGLGVRPKLTVGQPDDQYEREADAVAEAVTAGRAVPASLTGRAGGGDGAVPGLQVDETEEPGQTQSDGTDAKPSHAQGQPSIASSIRSPGAGRSLPEGVRRRIVPALGTGLDEVQVHTGTAAARAASNLGARAFTHRNHIFLGSGESPHDLALMAHEATHVVQQGAASAGHLSESTAPPDVQRVLSQSALQTLSSFTGAIPGWDKFTALLGKDPITDESVDKPPSEVLEEVVDLLPPWGKSILDALGEYELITDAFNLVQEELKQSDLSVNRVMTLLERAWEQLGFSDLVLGSDEGAIGILKEGFRDLYEDVVTFADDLVEKFLDLIQDVAVDVAERLLSEAGAWELATKVLGRDPLRDEEVDASPTEILEDFLIFFDREQHLEQMREQGTLEETATWLNEQLDQFTDLLGDLRDLIKRTWDLLKPAELPNLSSNLESLVTDAVALLSDVWDFVSTLAKEVLARIKESLLGWLNEFAREHITGFDLLTVIAGQNPFTGKDVARTGERLIQGFITLLPNGREIYQELAETGIVAEAGARIDEAVDDLEITWEYLRGLFVDLWEGFTIEDIAEPPAAFQRIVDTFQEPVTRIVNFVSVVLGEIFRVALKAMNFPSDLLGSIISNVMGAIDAIKTDPLGFLTNMLEAVELGFRNFFDNILTHLVGGLTDWLFEELRDAGLEPPSDFSLGSVLEFVLDVIGVTMDRLWEKLADRVGQENVERIREAMDVVTGVWEFVRDVQRQGIAAIWEYVTSQLRGLWDSVLELAQEWIVEKVINRAIEWLGGLLDPTGVMTVINSFQAFFNALQSAAEYLRDILAIIDDYVSTIVAVAQGQLETGAQTLEEGLASSIPVAIGFLARQLELGDIGQKIKEIVEGVRQKIDQAIEWLLDKAEAGVEKVLSAIGMGEEETEMDGEDEIEPTEPGDYEAFARSAAEMFKAAPLEGHESSIAAAQAFAEEHEPKLSEQLPDDVGLTFEFSEDPEAVADGVLEFTVVAAPNTSRAADEKALDCPSPGTSSDNIGVIGLHGKKPPSEDHYEFEVHYLRSEHIIPFRCTNILREAVGFNETARDKLGRFEKRQTTLMIYKQAGLMKDREDDAIISKFKSEFYATDLVDIILRAKSLYHLGNETQGEDLAMRAQAGVLSALEALKADAVERTKRYIYEEWQLVERGCEETNGQRRGEPHPLPDPDGGKVEEAADRQYDEVELLVANNLLAWFKQELELPDWESYSIHEDGVRQMLQEAGYNKPYPRDDGRWVIPRPGDQNLLKLTVDEEGMIHIGEI